MALLAVLSLVGMRASAANPSAEAETLIRQGVELRQQGHDERALPLFQRAYELVPSPRTAGQLGLAEMAVGYWLDSDQHLGEALQVPDHPWVAKSRRALEEARAQVRRNIGELVVEGAPPGATVTVNRRPAGTLPLAAPVRVAKGIAEVEVSAAGYDTAVRSQPVGGGEREQLTVNLDKTRAVATTPDARMEARQEPTPTATTVPPSNTLSASPAAVPAADDGVGLRRGIGWGLGIAGAAALVGAGIETIVWQNHRSDFNGNSSCDATQPNRGAGAGCSSLYDSIHQAETFAIVGYVLAAALGAGSAALFLTAKPSEPAASHVACAPALGAAFVNCRLSF